MMPVDLIILGSGGSSREILGAVEDINRQTPRWRVLGFLDDNPALQGKSVDDVPVLGPLASAKEHTAQLIVGVASWRRPGARREIVARLGLPRERYATVIHPSASISPRVTIGVGTAILQNVVITSGSVVGDHVLISQNVTMAHDDVIGDFVTIASAAIITGGVRLRAGCYLGAGCTIMNGVTVNEGALVGIGAVVMIDVPAGVTVSGYPARSIPQMKRS
jgi:sugar O-acyltransferase (sialic acid O-acetyltransferase NeuD family)